MQSYDGRSTTYEYSGTLTEFEDILIRKGIKTREQCLMERGLDPSKFPDKNAKVEEEEEREVTLADVLETRTIEELEQLEV